MVQDKKDIQKEKADKRAEALRQNLMKRKTQKKERAKDEKDGKTENAGN